MSAMALRRLLRPKLNHQHPPEAQRRAVENFARLQRSPKDVSVEELRLGSRPALKFTPAGADHARALLFLHGGGFVVGSPRSHQVMCAYLAKACGCSVYSLDYRLAPEHPFPAAVDDAEQAWQALQRKYASDALALAGDSAGACLSLSLLLRLRDGEASLPACALLICPLADLSLSSESIARNRHMEPLLTRDWLAVNNEYYAAETPLDAPEMSPAFADFSGLPPLLIQAAAHDLLLDDARRIHALAKDAGVDSKLEVFADLGHDFQLSPDLVPEAQRAIAMAGAWIKLRQ